MLIHRRAPILLLCAALGLAGPVWGQGELPPFGGGQDAWNRGNRGGQQRRAPAAIKSALFVTCTPKSVMVTGQQPKASKNPIADALELAGPGSTITLRPGDYPGFTIGFKQNNDRNAVTSGGLPGRPVTITGEGRVRIRPGRKEGDTISINQDVTTGHFLFRNLEIEPGYRAGIMFFTLKGNRKHEWFHFEDCSIIGSWDHLANNGKKSKWGVYGHSMSNFVFRGLKREAVIQNIQQEHAFYIQNTKGDILIENVRASRVGRTFCQFTAREKNGPVGVGDITVRNCTAEDTGLSKWDGHKGGSAFTVAGRVSGTVLFEGNTFRAGFHPELHRLTMKKLPYGTGAFVAWDGGEKVPNTHVILKNNDFEFARGTGDRPVVSLGGCTQVEVVGTNRFVSGGSQPAIAIDPTRGSTPGGKPKSMVNGSVYIDPLTKASGDIRVRGRTIGGGELAALGKRPAPPRANIGQRQQGRNR